MKKNVYRVLVRYENSGGKLRLWRRRHRWQDTNT